MPKHDPIRASKIQVLASEGKSVAEIADLLGIGYWALKAHIFRHKVKTTRRRVRKPTERARCVELRDKFTAREIARELGITRNAVIGHWYRDRQTSV
jgi:DNA-binding CsgD family transcriptional regulator